MKKFFILLFLVPLAVYSACPINTNGEAVCSVPGVQNNSLLNMNNQNTGADINSNQAISQPLPQENSLNQPFPKMNNQLMQYNSGCQFGICVQDLNNIRNPNQ